MLGHHHFGVALQHLGGVGGQRVDKFEVGECHFVSAFTQFFHSGIEVAIGSAEAYDEQFGIVFIALHLDIGHGYVCHLIIAQVVHAVVVLRFGADGACVSILLQSA